MRQMPSGSHIAAGIDGSETALGAARWAAALAGKLALPLRLVHSSSVRGLVPDVAYSDAEIAEMQRSYQTGLLTAAAESLRRWSPEVEPELVALDAAPAEGLAAASENAAVIVLGATGAGAVERWILGSTALRVAGSARCPVAVWRGDADTAGLDERPIVVGIDGSPESAAATRLAFEWARRLSVSVTAVRVWNESSAVGATVPDAVHLLGSAALVLDWDAIARAEAAKLTELIAPYRAEFPDVAVRLRSRRGSAGRELLHTLDEAQLAIVGSRGRGRFRGALLGSTSQNLLHGADRPIVVYPGAAT